MVVRRLGCDTIEPEVHGAVVAATSVPTVHYLVEKARDADVALRGVGRLLRLFDVAAVGRPELSPESTSEAGGTAVGGTE